jgi:hypothetical protein
MLIQSPVGEMLADASLGFAWSAPVFRFLRENTEGLLLLFLLSLYFDLFARRDLARLLERYRISNQRVLEDQLTDLLDPTTLIQRGLGALYPTIPSFPRAIEALDLTKPPFSNVSVDIHLTASTSEPDRNCVFNLTYAFDATIATFRVAFTSSTNLTETLISTGIVDDVVTLDREADLEALEGNKEASIELFHIKGDQAERLTFKKMSDRKVRGLTRALLGEVGEGSVFFEAKVQEPRDGRSRFRFTNRCELAVSEGYCYWTTPRTLFLSTLTIDTSRFPNRGRWSFIFQPFLGNARLATFALLGPDRYVLDLQEWIVRGQGIAVIWSPLQETGGSQ